MRKRVRFGDIVGVVGVALLLLIALPRHVRAQTPALTGTVVDSAGGAIAGATATVLTSANLTREKTSTDADGRFAVPRLPPGRYRVEIEQPLFKTTSVDIEIVEGVIAPPVRVVLQLAVGEVVTVEGASPYAARTAETATKTDTPLMETPFTVQVMPQQTLIDLGQQQNLGEAMRLLGIASTGYDSYVGSYVYRGFYSATTLWNGFRIEDLQPTAGPAWMDTIDRLEVLRGPASVLYGQVEPGGVTNVITKKPLDQYRGEVRVGVGSWADRWGSVDVTGPLNPSKTLTGRVVASGQLADSWFTYSPEYKSKGIAPQLAWRVTPQTTLAFEGQYREVDAETWQQSHSFILPSTGGFISAPRKDTRWPDNVGRWDQKRSMVSVDHRFNRDWSVSWKVMDDRTIEPWAYYQYDTGVDFSTLGPGVLDIGLALIYNSARTITHATTVDVLGHVSTWGVRHTLLTGGDLYLQDFDLTSGGFNNQGDTLTTNIFAPTRARVGPSHFSNIDRNKRSLYAQDQIDLPGQWHVLAGVRYEHVREDYSQNGLPSPTYERNLFTPRVGLLWRPQPWVSGYYSYSENQGQSLGFEYPGTPLKPEFSMQHEVGVKTEIADGRLNASVSLFRLTKENIASPDPVHGPSFVIGLGEVRSTGYELSLQGTLTDRWKALANYSYARPLVIVGSSGTAGFGNYLSDITAGELLPTIPLRNFSLFTSYGLRQLPSVTVGGGPSWRSRATPYSYSVNPVSHESVAAEAYWLASAFVRYQTRIGGYRTQFQVNVDNLFDKQYSSQTLCGDPDAYSCTSFLGNPRSVKLQMQIGF